MSVTLTRSTSANATVIVASESLSNVISIAVDYTDILTGIASSISAIASNVYLTRIATEKVANNTLVLADAANTAVEILNLPEIADNVYLSRVATQQLTVNVAALVSDFDLLRKDISVIKQVSTDPRLGTITRSFDQKYGYPEDVASTRMANDLSGQNELLNLYIANTGVFPYSTEVANISANVANT